MNKIIWLPGVAAALLLAVSACSEQKAEETGSVMQVAAEPAASAPAGTAPVPAVAAGTAQTGGDAAGTAPPGGAYSQHLLEVDERTVIAGLLDLEALRAAHPGKVHIVDMRTAEEGTAEEAAAAEAMGLNYTNIPVSSATVDPAQVEMLRATLAGADPDALVVVHCVSGNRAGMLWGAAQVAAGAPVEEVRDRLSGILTKPPAIEGLTGFAQSLNGGS